MKIAMKRFLPACLLASLASGLVHPGFAAEPDATTADLPSIPATEPAGALATFQLRPGIRLELAAAEPLVADPIAMCFDEDSRLFVVEMRDYSERRDERLGRIRLLEDTDEDGRMDKSTVFAEDLAWPTALFWWEGGLFVGATPDILYLKDTDRDGRADVRKVVFTGFGSTVSRLNVQQLINSFTWSLDNRIHGAAGGNGGVITSSAVGPPLELGNSDFSFDPRTLEMRRENGGGQFGMTFDDFGRKFVCANSAHIRQVMYEYRFVQPDMRYPLPPPALDIAPDGPSAEVFRISPDEPWRVLRTKWRVAGLVPGPIEGGGRASGYFTSASGITIYRGTALGPDFLGDAFIADVGSNLVHRKKLLPDGVPFKAVRAPDEAKSEFLASKDNWFRPVAFANAPDGALYIADMYRQVIEHPWSLPPNIKKHLDLNNGNDRGRIYRAVSTNFIQPKLPKLSRATTEELVQLLGHPNGWHRDTAARLIYERQDKAAAPSIQKWVSQTQPAHAQAHAIYALDGLGELGLDNFGRQKIALGLIYRLTGDSEGDDSRRPIPEANECALRLLGDYVRAEPVLLSVGDFSLGFAELLLDKSERVKYQRAWLYAAAGGNRLIGYHNMLTWRSGFQSKIDPWIRHAALAGISRDPGNQERFPEAFPANKAARPAAINYPAPPSSGPRVEAVKNYAAALEIKGDIARGQAIFLERCASCHRLGGHGVAVGPDLESVRAAGKEMLLGNIIDPNREVPPRFAAYEITPKGGGEPLTGVLANDAPNGVTLRQANGADAFIPRADIQAMKPTGHSLMPEGLEAGLTPEEMASLLARILTD